jgi:Capsular polysaccharide synthesis protein
MSPQEVKSSDCPMAGRRENFQSFWYGERLSPVANACMNSFRRHNFDFVLYTYGPVRGVPPFVTVKHAGDILPRDAVFHSCGGYEHFSDLFRYHLLCKEGGWWVDTDVVCNTNVVSESEIAFAGELEDTDEFSNGQIRFPKGHPVLLDLLRYVGQIDIEKEYGSTGPAAFTEIVRRHRIQNQKWRTMDFYPLNPAEAPKFLFAEFTDEVTEKIYDAPFVHLYTSCLRRVGFDVHVDAPPAGSYLDILYTDYCDTDLRNRLRPLDLASFRSRVRKYVEHPKYQKFMEEHGFSLVI